MSQFERKTVWLIDTSVFANILDIDGYNQQRDETMLELTKRVEMGDTLLLPFATIVETGNQIARINGNRKYELAEKFSEQVMAAIEGIAPWKAMKFPEKEEVLSWLSDFPNYAGKGIEFADFSMIKEFEEQKKLLSGYKLAIWTYNERDLGGYISE